MSKKKSNQEIEDSLKEEFQALEPVKEPAQPIKWPTWPLFWNHVKRKHRLSDGMEIAIKKHFETKGFNKPELFEKGLKDFGF